MDIKSYLDQVDQVFSGGGDSCDYGCDEPTVPQMITYIKNRFPAYPYCVVAGWVWLDVTLKPEIKALLDERGAKPCFIYAHKVIEDQAQRPFKSVRTTYLQDFQKNCIFLTKNTAYILVGRGTRVSIAPEVLRSIFF